ncbi:hypothetical protein ACFQO7_30225 [Catellatospora aurea]|uniref:Uncharacterized protein n=1 Tax=Catellatospora aurea TaxID=1337874 RepID=A0ABW2H638_9ACTN
MNDGGNVLVANRVDSTTWYSGVGIAESVEMIVTGVENGSWVDGTLGGVRTVAEAAVWVLDPVGALVTAGFAGVSNTSSRCRRHWIGSPAIRTRSPPTLRPGTTSPLSTPTSPICTAAPSPARSRTGTDQPRSPTRQQAGETLDLLAGLRRAAEGMKAVVAMSGSVVTLVRTLVRT